jgi:nitrite reductase (NADH) small subunit
MIRTATLPETYHGDVTVDVIDAIPAGEGRSYSLAGHRVAIFRERSGALHAVQAECPHQRGPLADGIVGGCTVICPMHSWKFDLTSGACLNDPAHRLRTYPIRDEGGYLIVTLEENA